MTDYGFINRLRLLRGRREAAQAHYRALIKLGFPEHEAIGHSGYNPYSITLREAALMLIGIALVLIGLFAVPVTAAEHDSAENNEAWFAACLGGAEIQVGDRAFRCLDVGPAR